MWIFANPNPKKHMTASDCVVRAIAICLNLGWYEIFDRLYSVARNDCNMPSDNRVWGHFLYLCGFEPIPLPECPECITLKEFCQRYYKGKYVVGTGSHAVAVMDGNYYDTFDSGNEILSYFWRMKGDQHAGIL